MNSVPARAPPGPAPRTDAGSSRTRTGSSEARQVPPGRLASCPTATQSPEFSNYAGRAHARQRAQQGTWSSPVTNRLLLDAGFGTNYSHYGGQEMPGNPTRAIPKMQEQCAQPPVNAVPGARADGIQNLTVRIAGLGEQPGLYDDVARRGAVRHWCTQHEVRLSGCLPPREPELLRQRYAPAVSPQSRRAQPAHDGSEASSTRDSAHGGKRSTHRSNGRSAA